MTPIRALARGSDTLAAGNEGVAIGETFIYEGEARHGAERAGGQPPLAAIMFMTVAICAPDFCA
jgi:hypothetical protein